MKNGFFTALWISLGLFCSSLQAGPASLKAVSVVQETEPFVGASFIFQIQVTGSEKPEQPDLSQLTDFEVTFQGGQQNSSRSMTIINGKVTQDVREGYYFSYELTPKRAGDLRIPSITVKADGLSTRTNPLVIHARQPVETDDFKLQLELSKDHCYVGEPVILTVTWYIGKDVKEYEFKMPLLKDESFRIGDPHVDTQAGKKIYRLRVGDRDVVGQGGKGRIGDKSYTTIRFEKIMIPLRSGTIPIEPATVACKFLAGYEGRRRMFDDDFFSDFFGRGRSGIYRTVVVPSNALSLKVSALPKEGRPSNFAGHVGEYEIRADATPTEVSVGDPITLTISVSGPEYLDFVDLPPLDAQPDLVSDFKIPKERATGVISGQSKVFTQTIRALSPDVTEIPPIELPYFDTGTETYRIAKSQAIPISVKKTRIVTAQDAEGISGQVSGGSEVETWSQGIAFNYDDLDVIENQRLHPLSWVRSPLVMSLIVVPPILYVLLFTGVAVSRRSNADPAKARAKRAYSRLTRALHEAGHAESSDRSCIIIQDAFRHYLGDKLTISKGALTYNDVRPRLAAKSVDEALLVRLRDLFHTCEIGRYAGGKGLPDSRALNIEAIKLAKDLEKELK